MPSLKSTHVNSSAEAGISSFRIRFCHVRSRHQATRIDQSDSEHRTDSQSHANVHTWRIVIVILQLHGSRDS